MNQIKCPNCGEVFTIDESSYESIVNRIKNEQFERELSIREKASKEKFEAELELLKERLANENKGSLQDKDKTIEDLKHQQMMLEKDFEAKLAKELAKKDSERQELATRANDAVAKLKADIEGLKSKIDSIKTEEKAKADKAIAESEMRLSESLNTSKMKIAELTHQLESKETESELKIEKAVSAERAEKEKQLAELNNQLVVSQQKYELELQMTKEELERVKEHKLALTTKAVGEDLEQYCKREFDKVRMMGYRTATFEKDNDASDGTKGDFIFRDYKDGTEYISIMFEMKNENDATKTKHKNADFFDKLDKDRKKKDCEYAVLVSMLEQEDEFYNQGIVEVYDYEKMYVVRPQMFLQLISLLRNAALSVADTKYALEEARRSNLDLTHFQENVGEVIRLATKHNNNARAQFSTAIKDIDDAIKKLTDTKEALLKVGGHMDKEEGKLLELQDIKKLTKDAPTVRKIFDDLDN